MTSQCALRGCTVEIEQPVKGPKRKFCCPAHRTAARSARLRASGPDRSVPAAEPSSENPPDTGAATAPDVEMGTSSAPQGEADTGAPRVDAPQVESPVQPPAGQQWATEAQIALASINRQLGNARAAEQRWAAAAGPMPSYRQPLELTVLTERRLALRRMRTALESQLGVWRNLQGITAALTIAQNQLSQIDLATRGPSAPGSTTPGSSQQLTDQHRRLVAQIELRRGQLRQWREEIEMAMSSTPGPNPFDVTTPLVRQIDGLIKQRCTSGPSGAPPRQPDDARLAEPGDLGW